jgi:dihydroorotate dehydrogenase electron transfer subunit
VTVLVGARSGDHVLCEREFREHGTGVEVSTDDGSYGHPGLVTDLLRVHLESLGPDADVRVYSCGPTPMMKIVAQIAAEYGCHCQVSLEKSMACGLGVCMGCVTKACDHSHEDHECKCEDWKYKRVCTDGPVFNAKELVWE